MTRTILTSLFGLFGVAFIALAPAGCQSGGVGDPCTPEDEYSPQFAGYKLTEENIESRSFQCQTRICLVNHFQGRVSCPLGQTAPAPCTEGQLGQTDANGAVCVRAATEEGTSFVFHKPGNCQTAEGGTGDCCVPGTDIPVVQSVCGQCDGASRRNGDDAVYCSCRCGVADGEPEDPSFNFCECPDGYECSEIRRNVGISDKQITGKYCIKSGSAYKGTSACGMVKGAFDQSQCFGLPSAL
jgi:hypothetical protein